MTIVEFLLARIAEDEVVARATTPAPWRADGSEVLGAGRDNPVVDYAYTPANAEHIARHDPARVLAECAVKRRIVEDFRDCPAVAEADGQREALEYTCRDLATVYADHPDYDPAWRVIGHTLHEWVEITTYGDHPDDVFVCTVCGERRVDRASCAPA